MGPMGSDVVGGVVAALVIGALVAYVLVVRQRRQKRPPGPWPWPVVGNLGVLSGLPHRNLQALAGKYGGLMYLQLGRVPCLAVCTAAAAREVFTAHDAAFSNRPRRLDHEVISGTTYKSLTSAPYGKYWRQARRVCNAELFSPALHAAHERVRGEEVHAMMRTLLAAARAGHPVDLQRWATAVTANNMTRMLINKRYFGPEASDQQHEFEQLLDRVFAAAGAFFISDFIPYLRIVEKLRGTVRKLEAIRAFLRRVVGRIFEVESHRQRALDGTRGTDYVPDFVDVLLETQLDDGARFTDGEIISILSSMIYAGTESSANTVVWAMSELMANADVMRRVQEELDAVVGSSRLVREADIASLPFLRAVVRETFRLHPAVPLSLPRCSDQPCVVAGCMFPADTRLILNIFAIHRDPSVYKNPDSFQPSRFLEVDNVAAFQLIPFGVGRRMCPASNLGTTIVTLMVASLVHSFDWRLPEGASVDMAEVYKLVNFRKQPLSLIAIPRSPAYLY